MKYLYPFILVIALTFVACNNDEGAFTPKPHGFPRIEFPENKVFQKFDEGYCNFSFEIPSYATVEQDKLFFDEKPAHPCWFDLNVPALNAKVHCSYYPINKKNPFDKMRTDAFRMANEHTIKADYIDDLPINNKEKKVHGFVFDIQGTVASPFQFYLTDSTNHFMRGSLYVNDKSKSDSLAPIYEFMKKDIMHMINTFEWND